MAYGNPENVDVAQVSLANIAKATWELSGGGSTGVQRTLSVSQETGSTNSPVPAGAKSILFEFSTDFVGTIKGIAYTGAVTASKPYDAPTGDTLPAIAYTVTAGSLIRSALT